MGEGTGLACSDADHDLDEVEARHQLRHRVLHLIRVDGWFRAQDPGALGIPPRRMQFLMSEVPLYAQDSDLWVLHLIRVDGWFRAQDSGPRPRPTVGSCEEAVSYERGTPVSRRL